MQGRAGTGELNYLSQFDIKGSDQILRRALTENCHTHSDSDRGQDTKYIQSIVYLLQILRNISSLFDQPDLQSIWTVGYVVVLVVAHRFF